MGGDLTFEKSNTPSMGARLVVKSPRSMTAIHLRKQLVNSYVACGLTNAKNFE